MDLFKMQQIHTIKKSNKKQQLLDNLFMYSLTALTCSLFCSSPFWFPWLCSSIKVFLFIFLPKISSVFFTPKSLFIVGNLIIVVLIGQSKFFASDSSPSSDGYYDEYISTSRSLRTSATLEDKKERKVENYFEGNYVKEICEDEEKLERKESVQGKIVEKGRVEYLDGEVDQQLTLPAEELNRRADDFIARVNRRRRLEARLLVNSCNV